MLLVRVDGPQQGADARTAGRPAPGVLGSDIVDSDEVDSDSRPGKRDE